MKIEIYTDGSCSQSGKSEGPGGWSFVYYLGEEQVIRSGSSKKTTNNRMELTAFLEALKEYYTLKKENNLITELSIFSDSAYITNCFKQEWYKRWMRNGWINSKKKPISNQDLWGEIFKYYFLLIETSNLEIIKVKGHSDIEGNNLADMYAVKARMELNTENKEECNNEKKNEKSFNINSLY